MVKTLMENLLDDCSEVLDIYDYHYWRGYINALCMHNIISWDEQLLAKEHLKEMANIKGILN